MIDFVDTPPFLIIALQVAMTTMHSHIAQTGLFMWSCFFAFSGSQGPILHQFKFVPGVPGRSK